MMLDFLKRDGYWYVATPYARYHAGREQAFIDASAATADLLKNGVVAFSPIAHSHPIASYGNMPLDDHSFWLPFDENFMRLACGCIVLEMPGWEESKGVAHEIAFFKDRGMPIEHLSWPDLKPVL